MTHLSFTHTFTEKKESVSLSNWNHYNGFVVCRFYFLLTDIKVHIIIDLGTCMNVPNDTLLFNLEFLHIFIQIASKWLIMKILINWFANSHFNSKNIKFKYQLIKKNYALERWQKTWKCLTASDYYKCIGNAELEHQKLFDSSTKSTWNSLSYSAHLLQLQLHYHNHQMHKQLFYNNNQTSHPILVRTRSRKCFTKKQMPKEQCSGFLRILSESFSVIGMCWNATDVTEQFLDRSDGFYSKWLLILYEMFIGHKPATG